MTPLDWVLAVAAACLIAGGVFVYFVTRVYKCPKCLRRSDHDHIAEVTAESPYCPYCGTQTVYVGRKYDLWLHRFGLDSGYTVITADDPDHADAWGEQTYE